MVEPTAKDVINLAVPWAIEREGSALRVQIQPPMDGEWETLMDELQANLKPMPKAVYLPTRLSDGTRTDADMLKIIWQSLTDIGVPILTPR
jgi:hypothetical protein